jgi:NAD(P)-dependent dehydrogenase (short-subunit alcohol dehydrogenase family)
MDIEQIIKSHDFSGAVIVMTGGTGVLGSEMASALVRSGANVAILTRDPSRAGAVKKRLDIGPGRAMVVAADVLLKESVRQAAEAVQDNFGRVHALINAAGGNAPGATTSRGQVFFDLPEEYLKQVVDLNLLGTVVPCQVFGRLMAEAGEGNIINIASMAGFRPLTRTVAYSAAKAAVSNFTQWLAVHMAQEYSPRIRVNAIAPGFFDTQQNHFLLFDEKTGELTPRGRSIIDHTPMRRFGNPEDLLGTLFWLLSPGAEFVTGAVVAVDGGFAAFSGV